MSVTTRKIKVVTVVDQDVTECDACSKTTVAGAWKDRTGMEAGWIDFVVSMGDGRRENLDACSFACLAIYAASRDEAQKVRGGKAGDGGAA